VLCHWASEHEEIKSHAKRKRLEQRCATMASSSRRCAQGRRSGHSVKRMRGKKRRGKGFHP
jgi:hypothetical protein